MAMKKPKLTAAERVERDLRFRGLRESPHTAQWRVPYTTSTPGSKGGTLKIFATSADDALERAKAWHALRPVTPAYSARRAPRATLTYGTPEQVGPEAGPSYYTKETPAP